DARLEDVRPPRREGRDDLGHSIAAEHGEALAGQRHRQGDPDVAEADDADPLHSSSPSATSRLAFSRPAGRPVSIQYARMGSATTGCLRSMSFVMTSGMSIAPESGAASSTARGDRT